MSVGNPKKFENLPKLDKVAKQDDGASKDAITKVYKDQNHEVKKALRFRTGSTSKLA